MKDRDDVGFTCFDCGELKINCECEDNNEE